MKACPENVVLATGLPCSGVTALARALGTHSQVDPLTEPHRRRDGGDYRETDLERIFADFGIEPRRRCSLLIGVTATAPGEMKLALECLDRAPSQDLRAATIVIVRSPVAAFIDQAGYDDIVSGDAPELAGRVDAFWHSARLSLGILGLSLPRFARRAVLYDRLIEQPRLELARLMALFPYQLEPAQLEVDLGADSTVDLSRAGAGSFGDWLPDSSAAQHMLLIHELIESFDATADDDSAILDQLLLAVDSYD